MLVKDHSAGNEKATAKHWEVPLVTNNRLTKMGLSIPAIFMTGCDDASHRERAAQVGAAAYLVKPFEDIELLGAIGAALEKH